MKLVFDDLFNIPRDEFPMRVRKRPKAHNVVRFSRGLFDRGSVRLKCSTISLTTQKRLVWSMFKILCYTFNLKKSLDLEHFHILSFPMKFILFHTNCIYFWSKQTNKQNVCIQVDPGVQYDCPLGGKCVCYSTRFTEATDLKSTNDNISAVKGASDISYLFLFLKMLFA